MRMKELLAFWWLLPLEIRPSCCLSGLNSISNSSVFWNRMTIWGTWMSTRSDEMHRSTLKELVSSLRANHVWQIWRPSMLQHQRVREEQVMSATWTCAKHWHSHKTSLSPEKGNHENFIQFNKDRFKILHPGQGNPKHQYKLGVGRIQSSLEEKDFGYFWVKNWMWNSIIHLQPRKQAVSRATSKGREREVIPSLICSLETPPAILHSALRPQNRT